MQNPLNKSRFIPILIALSLLASLSGCIKNKVRIVMNEDGSGHIIVSRIFRKEIVDAYTQQMDEMAMQMPATVEMPEDPFYNEKQIKREAGQFGPGVEFLKAKKFDHNGARGHIAVYKFEDINDIFINLNNSESMAMSMSSSVAGMEEEMEIAEKGENAISFALKGGTSKELHVDIPDYPASSVDPDNLDENAAGEPAFGDVETQAMMQQMNATGNPYGITGKETQGEMIKKIMKGIVFSATIEVKAGKQEANADHVRKTSDGRNRYILLEMDMDKMLEDEKSLQIMCAQDSADMGPMSGITGLAEGLQFYSNMNGLSGITVQTNDFVISFEGE